MAAQQLTTPAARRRTRFSLPVTLPAAVPPAPTFPRETAHTRANVDARRIYRLKCALAALVE